MPLDRQKGERKLCKIYNQITITGFPQKNSLSPYYEQMILKNMSGLEVNEKNKTKQMSMEKKLSYYMHVLFIWVNQKENNYIVCFLMSFVREKRYVALSFPCFFLPFLSFPYFLRNHSEQKNWRSGFLTPFQPFKWMHTHS